MSVYSFVFSPTSGTEKVMNILAAEFGGAQTIDLTDAGFTAPRLTAEDVCLFGVPSFGGRVPGPAMERIAKISGNGAKAVLVAVYGNRAIDDTLAELKHGTDACGFKTVAAVSAIAEHSIMRNFAAGRPDEQDAEELRGFAKQILANLNPDCEIAVPGNVPEKPYAASAMKPITGDACTGCGLCAEKCPVGAIPADDPSKTDPDKCFTCMRCISVCPVGARALNPEIVAGITQRLAPVCSDRKNNELVGGADTQ